jgi:hypothetical protein
VIWLCESELHPWLLALEHSGGEYGQCFEDGLIRLVAWICVVLNVYSEDLVIIRPYQSQRVRWSCLFLAQRLGYNLGGAMVNTCPLQYLSHHLEIDSRAKTTIFRALSLWAIVANQKKTQW